ncbi:MAG: DUF4468 domain-containing protein [Bacteroidetes bacterium]|nr:DUF4468 domain-containing protein [Bacteroidota bacterium]MBL0078510.1 DUF4468 domain-containing protein [Bacteroidota bacterium]
MKGIIQIRVLCILFLFFVNFNLFAQEDSISKPFSYSKVIKFDSTFAKNEIFNSAEIWISKYFNSSLFVVEVKDKEAGLLSGGGNFKFIPKGLASTCYQGIVEFHISIFVKEGRLKLELTNFFHDADNSINSNVDCELGMIMMDENYRGAKTYWGTTKSLDQKNWADIHEKIKMLIAEINKTLIEEVNNKTKLNSDW